MPTWLIKFKLKDLLDDEDVGRDEAKRLGEEVAKRIEEHGDVFGKKYQNSLIALFRHDCFSQHDFNGHLNTLYDYADEKRIWIE